MMSFRKAHLIQSMGLIFRRKPRRREILYFGLGIFILNLAVSYFYTSNPVWIESNSSGSNEIPGSKKQNMNSMNQNHNAKRTSIDAMPISIDVKQYKVPKLSRSPKNQKGNSDPIIGIMNSQIVKDLKIAVAISDLENFVKKKEAEEMEATRKDDISQEESSVESELLSKLSSQNSKNSGEIKVEDNDVVVKSREEIDVNEEMENTLEEVDSKFEDLENSRLKDMDKMFNNPWLSKHRHQSEDEGLLQMPSDEFEIKSIADTGCSIRSFKNASVFSSSEFIHEYIKYKRCIKDVKGLEMAEWQRKIIIKTGSKGQLIVDSTNKYDIHPKDFCANPGLNNDRSHHASPKVLYLILSNHTEIEAKMRESIRSTWSTDINKTLSDNHSVLFFLGRTKSINKYTHAKLSSSANIMEEGKIYNDIVVSDVDESDPQYHMKQIFSMLSWTYKYCESARFVVKTTSNTYVNLKILEQFADQEMFAANRIYGSILKRRYPDRNIKGIHYISEEDWPWDYFPPFLREPTFIMSGDIVPRLLLAASITPQIRLESVYIAGVLPALIGLSRIEVNSFFREDMPEALSPKIIDKKNECAYGKYGMIHEIKNPIYMEQIDTLIHDMRVRNVTCQVAPRCKVKVEGRCVLKGDEGDEENDSNKKGSKKKKKSLFLQGGSKLLGSLLGDKTAVLG